MVMTTVSDVRVREDAALSFLQLRDVISRDFMFRFIKASSRAAGLPDTEHAYFPCPSDCGRFLLSDDPSYAGLLKRQAAAAAAAAAATAAASGGGGAKDATAADAPADDDLQLGSCPCGALVCVRCHGAHKPADGPFHICPDLQQLHDDVASSKLIASIGKKCPACGLIAQKDGGCDLMMCGTSAHGKVADALQNGGCAYIFHWSTLAGCNDGYGYTDIDGVFVTGKGPTTHRQQLLGGTG